MSFTAKYRGSCANCDEGITPGEEVAYRGEGEARELVHVRCPPAFDLTVTPACTVCWIIHPAGACDA